MRTLNTILLIGAFTLLVLPGCKSPRPPQEAAVGDVSGEWSARSVAAATPQPADEMLWRLLLEEEEGGRIRGHGSLRHAAGSSSFSVNGICGESVINFDLHMEDGERAKFDGSIMDRSTMVGEMDLRRETIPVTFTRP